MSRPTDAPVLTDGAANALLVQSFDMLPQATETEAVVVYRTVYLLYPKKNNPIFQMVHF